MTSSDDLYAEIFSLPSDQQQQIINRIGAQYDTTDEDFIINTDTIYNYLIENNFRPPYTSEHINEFIDDITTPQYEEYFQERVNTDDYDDEITQLQQLRDEIDQRIHELQTQQLQQEMFTQQQQHQQQLQNDYDDMYINGVNQWVSNTTQRLGDSHKVETLMKTLYEKPFDTDINLKSLSFVDCIDIAPRLKQWFEDKIKNIPLNTKIGVVLTVNGEDIFWTLNNEHVMNKLKQMFNGDFSFSSEQLPSLRSDDDTNINITWIDNIKFVIIPEYNKKKGERSNHPSAFFEYRLNDEYNEFEQLLSKYQIFTRLDDDKHKHCREELKYNCLIYALSSKISDVDKLAQMSNYFVNISHIPTNKLTDFCKHFNINIMLYSYNDKGKLDKLNKKNGGVYGDKNAPITFTLATFKNHYFIYEQVPVSNYYLQHREDIRKYAIEHNWDMNKCWLVVKKSGNRYRIDSKQAHMTSLELVKRLMDMNAFKPLYRNDTDVDIAGVFHYVHNKQDIQQLGFTEDKHCKLMSEKKPKKEIEYKYFYADFETCYNHELNQEMEFMLCIQDIDGVDKKTFIGNECGKQMLEYLPNNSVVYFHNLGFDGRLLMKYGIKNNIVKGSRIIQQTNYYKGKTITLRDSFSMFSQKLANFPRCFPNEFKGLNIQKELFPYRYYTYERVLSNSETNEQINKPIGVISECGKDELPAWNNTQREQFVKNIDNIPGCRLDNEHFDMFKYCEFYCQQDVNVLRIGYNAFRQAALNEPINLDIFNYLTAPALAQAYLNREVFIPNNNLYMLSGHVRDFVMKAIYGGRCMTKQNKRWRITDKLDDFDACSLYPSAMARLFTVEGTPQVLTDDMLNREYLLTHSFTEDQIKPTKDRHISYYIVEINITNVGINRDFPLIVERTKTNNMNVNKSCKMVVDMIQLEDMIKYQQIEFTPIRGYYWIGNRDHRIRDTIRKLFKLRAEYKKQGNSIQQIIKLIMNSGYGKSIQKPIDNELKYINEDKFEHYLYEHWHNIQECKKIPKSNQYMVKINKITDKQFNNCVFGVSVLSMSKRIMNEVMCLAEDLNINIYYQDTDSMHIEHDKISLLAERYKQIHGRELIGEDTIGCFHNDFDELTDAFTTLHISLGKKMYYDELTNTQGGHAEHFRMKGIPNAVIVEHANKYFNNSVKSLYEHMYEGNEITFNLNSVCVRFEMNKIGEIKHKNKFIRKVKATSPLEKN